MKKLIHRILWPVHVRAHRDAWPLAVRLRLERILIWAGDIYL